MFNIRKTLKSVGMGVFVKYYDEIRDCTDSEALAKKIKKNEGYSGSVETQIMRIKNAKRIFENHAENDALGMIIDSKAKADVINEAKRLKEMHISRP